MALLGSVITIVAALAALVFWIQILIVAFKTHIGWGLGSLLIPFVGLVFIIMHWQETKTPFLRGLICVVVQFIGIAISAMGSSG